MELIYLLLLVTFGSSIEAAGEPCSTADHLPVVNMCTNKTQLQTDNDSILIQANIKQNCTCELSVINQDKDVSVNIQKFSQHTSSSPSEYGCGLILKFKNKNNYFWYAQCIVDIGTTTQSISINEKITIRSLTVNGTLKTNEGYCFEINKAFFGEPRNKLKLICGIGSTNIKNTTQSGEKTTKITLATTPTTTTTTMPKITTVPMTVTTTESTTTQTTTVPTTTTEWTTTQTTTVSTTTTTTESTTTQTTTVPTTTTTTVPTTTKTKTGNFTNSDGSVATNQANMKDNDDAITIAVGASVGGFVIIILATIVVCIYSRRNHPKSTSKPSPTVDTNNDDYGLRDNVLYVSSEPSDTTQTPNNADIPFTNRISVDIDGNYSTVDLDEIEAVEKSTGDNSSIDLEKPTPTAKHMNESANKKPIIAPKPKQKTAIQEDVYAVPDKKRVKHVTAPGDDGCEYAVVSKSNKANVDKRGDQPSTSNAYAVVEKKKRVSDGKGTNKKRDSFTAENDSETGQS